MKTIITLSNISVTSKCPYEQALWSGTSPLKKKTVQKISDLQEEQLKCYLTFKQSDIIFKRLNIY